MQPAGMTFFRPAVEVQTKPLGDLTAVIGGVVQAVSGAAGGIAQAFAAPEYTKQAQYMAQAQMAQAQAQERLAQAQLAARTRSSQTTLLLGMGGLIVAGTLGILLLKK